MPSPSNPAARHSSVTFGRAQPPTTTAAPITEPYVYREYPRWMYHHDQPARQVENDDEREALGPTWGKTPEEAERLYQRTQELIANAAAERAYSDQKLSAKARAEKLKQERATDHHVPE